MDAIESVSGLSPDLLERVGSPVSVGATSADVRMGMVGKRPRHQRAIDVKAQKPTRILYCETNIDGTIGGSYYSLLYLVKGLDRSRYHPTVLFYKEHALLSAFHEAGAETVVWPRGEAFSFAARLSGAPRWLRLPLFAVQKTFNLVRGYIGPTLSKTRYLKMGGFGIVHLNNSILYNHDWMAAARLAGVICVGHERGVNEAYPAAARYFGSHLDRIVCISRAVHENMHRCGAGFPNVVTIHNGLDPQAMMFDVPPATLRARYGIAPTAPVVVMIGNIKEWKGQEVVVRAIELVRQRCPDVRCLFVGDTSPADREYEQRLRRLTSDLGLDGHILFTGFQRRVADFVLMSDVVVHASVLPEPFGRVILEAMACRKPVIGSGGGAIPELIADGETGRIFPPGDSKRLGEDIIDLLCDPIKAKRLGQSGYDRLNRHFHIDRHVESIQHLYEELLADAR